jgi:hypothetical protein
VVLKVKLFHCLDSLFDVWGKFHFRHALTLAALGSWITTALVPAGEGGILRATERSWQRMATQRRSVTPSPRKETLMFTAWANFAMLALESQQVVALRLMKLAAGGPAAATEINLMTLEKLEASANESGRVLLGASHESVIKRYRKRVRSNRRRLLR